MSRLLKTSLKSSVFANVVFWILVNSIEGVEFEYTLLAFFSQIIFFVICAVAIFFTIMPLFSIDENKLNERQIFNKYFPFYSICSFIICAYGVLESNFNIISITTYSTAFFTSIISWVWYCESKFSKNTLIKSQEND